MTDSHGHNDSLCGQVELAARQGWKAAGLLFET
jgi:hypothetical protein